MPILAVSLPTTRELGQELQAVLNSSLEIAHTNLQQSDLQGDFTILHKYLSRIQPRMMLLCVSQEETPALERIFYVVRGIQANIAIIVILRTADAKLLDWLFRMGAADFCLAPLRLEDLLTRVARWSTSSSQCSILKQQLETTLGLQQFLGESAAFLQAINKIPRLARCGANVFISGETGTGKEMCARAIHHLGPRADHPFVPVNCGAIPPDLVENELFGHEAGAFTSASAPARGLVHEADGGTLFLDEIDSLPLQTQVKFLRFLQDQVYRPLGGKKSVQADVRVIAASNADVEEAVRSHKFRADLFYRLNVLTLSLPALRHRRDDIPLLARHFTGKYAREYSMPIKDLSRTAIEKLVNYGWPGNIRELENTIERAVVLSERPLITGEDIPLRVPGTDEEISFKVLKAQAIADFESGYIRRVLTANDGNISKAARAAKKNRRAFWQLMRKHDIVVSDRSSATTSHIG